MTKTAIYTFKKLASPDPTLEKMPFCVLFIVTLILLQVLLVLKKWAEKEASPVSRLELAFVVYVAIFLSLVVHFAAGGALTSTEVTAMSAVLVVSTCFILGFHHTLTPIVPNPKAKPTGTTLGTSLGSNNDGCCLFAE